MNEIPTFINQTRAKLATEKPASTYLALDTEPITNYYCVENDLAFLKNFASHLTREEKAFYLKENVFGLLCEFAGKIPYMTRTYIYKNGKLSYAGVPLIPMLEQTTRLADRQRVAQENKGLIKIFQRFEDSQNPAEPAIKQAFIISPPEKWSYGFVFYYHTAYSPDLDAPVVKMHLLCYPEKKEELRNSQAILAKIAPQMSLTSTKEFLETPFFDTTTSFSLSSLLRAIKISDSDIEKAKLFEEAIAFDPLITFWLNQYIDGVLNENLPTTKLDELIRAIYSRAQEIKEKIDARGKYRPVSLFLSPAPPLQINGLIPPEAMLIHYAGRPSLVIGGGSCPPIRRKEKFSSLANIAQSLISGRSVERILISSLFPADKDQEDYEGYPCQHCGGKIPWEKDESNPQGWRTHCPHCGEPIIRCV